MRIVRTFVTLCKCLLAVLIGGSAATYLCVRFLPLGAPSAELQTITPKSVVDIHTHVAGLGYGGSGCFVGQELGESYKRAFYLKAFLVNEEELKEQGDSLVVQRLSELVGRSKLIKQAVVLALDGVVDEHGQLAREKTQVYVPNEFVRIESAKYPNLLYGASVHPNRSDALERLRNAKEDGAVLIKWIPSIMHIDPSDKRYIPFYQELVRLGLPLLTHAGQERAFANAVDDFGDPEKLRLPLAQGVTVIAAHVATTGKIDGEEMIDRLIPLFAQYPNLLTDISSLTQVNKLKYVDQALLNGSIEDRMLYGSDWPLQFFPIVSPWFHVFRLDLSDLQFIRSFENQLDRDVLLKLALGMSRKVLTQTDSFVEPRSAGLR